MHWKPCRNRRLSLMLSMPTFSPHGSLRAWTGRMESRSLISSHISTAMCLRLTTRKRVGQSKSPFHVALRAKFLKLLERR
jgi:hypothetical protein